MIDYEDLDTGHSELDIEGVVLSGGFRSWWASLTSVDPLRNEIGEAMERRCYSCLALRHQLLSHIIPLPLPAKGSIRVDDVNPKFKIVL